MVLESLISLEAPLSYGTLAFALIVVTWRTVGLSWIPKWDDIWGDSTAFYPRREANLQWWNRYYLILYGGVGTVGQICDFLITVDGSNRSTTTVTIWRARMLGFFHCIIALHHIAWSSSRRWGRLELSQLQLPFGGYLPFGVAGILTGYHGLELVLTSTSTPFLQILRHKTLVDASSLMTLIEILFFYPMLLFNCRNLLAEQIIWTITFTSPLIMFGLDFIDAYYD